MTVQPLRAGNRMPKPTEEDREGYALYRMGFRQLKQYDNQAHTTSPFVRTSPETGGTDWEN